MKRYRCVSVMATLVLVFGTAAKAAVITHGGTTINMDFVTVGNAGNVADTEVISIDGTTGYGAVGYNYRIGKHEVSADQWAAVIAADSSVGNAAYWSGSQPTGRRFSQSQENNKAGRDGCGLPDVTHSGHEDLVA